MKIEGDQVPVWAKRALETSGGKRGSVGGCGAVMGPQKLLGKVPRYHLPSTWPGLLGLLRAGGGGALVLST